MVQAQPDTKILFVGDTTGYDGIISYFGMIPATILMPDYAMMEADVNGDISRFNYMYYQYLDSQSVQEFLITILAALNQCKHIILFVPGEASGLHYQTALLAYILDRFGIQTAYGNVPFSYNEAFTVLNAGRLYAYNLIGPSQYLLTAGEGFNMINKLIADTGIQFANGSESDAYNYFNQWRLRMLKADRILVKPFGLSY
jgi:hypothetical protein